MIFFINSKIKNFLNLLKFYNFITNNLLLINKNINYENFFLSNRKNNVKNFEKKFAKILGSGTAVSYAAGRMAFYEVLNFLKIREGDEVILTGSTCAVMANAVVRTGAKCIFSDIDANNYGSCPKSILKNITSKTKCVVAQHSFGLPCEINKIKKICKKKKIFLIEDCALTFDSKYNNIKVGNFGDAAIFSTDHTKPINTFIGGLAYSSNKKLIKYLKIKQKKIIELNLKKKQQIYNQVILENKLINSNNKLLRFFLILKIKFLNYFFQFNPFLNENNDLNQKSSYPYPALMPDFLAYLGVMQLKNWNKIKKNKQKLLNTYLKILKKNNKLVIPKAYYQKNLEIVPLRFIFYSKKAKLIRKKISRYIDIQSIWFLRPLINSNISLEKFNYSKGSCPVSERICKEVINLPCNANKMYYFTFFKFLKNIVNEKNI